jgi:hypothetical protein
MQVIEGNIVWMPYVLPPEETVIIHSDDSKIGRGLQLGHFVVIPYSREEDAK